MRPTLVFQDCAITPDEFEDRWRRSAAALSAAGVGDGDIVALMMRNSPEAIELMVAARHLGAQWCPVNWHFKTDEVQYVLDNCAAKVFIADAALLASLHGLDTAGTRSSPPAARSPARPCGNRCAPPRRRPRRQRPRRAARCSTRRARPGRPRASRARRRRPHRPRPRCRCGRIAYGIEPGMRALRQRAAVPQRTQRLRAAASLRRRGTLCLEERFDAERTLQLIHAHRLSHAYLVPTMFVAC